MTMQKGIAQMGLAKQAAKGAAATAPTYTLGLTGGSVGGVDVEQSNLDTTWSSRGVMGVERLSVTPTAELETIATPAAIGLLLKLALGAETVTGAGPYSHAFTPGQTLPYATIFGMVGGGNKTAISDAKLDSLELSWDKTGAVRVKAGFKGCTYDMASTWAVGSTGETVASGNTVHPGGGTFQIGGDSYLVTAGSIKFENSLEPVISSASGLPGEVMEKDSAVTISLTTMPDDVALFKLAVTGSKTGTSISTDPVFAAFNIVLNGPSGVTLTFAVASGALMAKLPDVSADGGPGEIPVEATVVGSPGITVTLVNSVTSAY